MRCCGGRGVWLRGRAACPRALAGDDLDFTASELMSRLSYQAKQDVEQVGAGQRQLLLWHAQAALLQLLGTLLLLAGSRRRGAPLQPLQGPNSAGAGWARAAGLTGCRALRTATAGEADRQRRGAQDQQPGQQVHDRHGPLLMGASGRGARG
jgi:hypothetical protein